MVNIGVLSFQGSVIEHISMLKKIDGVNAISVKYLPELNNLDGIILPGGESTAISNMLNRFDMMQPLKSKIENGLPVWGTCAGMILLAKRILNQQQTHLSVMDIEVRRNAYGSQNNSFSTRLNVEGINKPVESVFIRAPWIESVFGNARAICTHEGKIVGARQNNMIATSFHPELTQSTTFHRYFVDLVKANLLSNK